MNQFSSAQIILVTGASSGIGRACALLCNRLGATVIACGRNEERLHGTERTCTAPDRWHTEIQDLCADIEDLPRWVNTLRMRYGRLWGLIHAAGEGRLDSISSFSLPEARKHLELNFLVPMQLAKGFADRRNFVRGGAMLFLSSAAAVHPEKGHCLYGAAKAALSTAMKAVSQEMAPKGLRVNCLAPGWVRTPMLEEAARQMGGDFTEAEERRYPLGFGQPEDVAAMAAFLLSDSSRWCTGQTILLDGGRY